MRNVCAIVIMQMRFLRRRGATAGKRESSAKFEDSYPVKPYNAENAQFAPLLQIECRGEAHSSIDLNDKLIASGLEFVDFDPRVSPS